MQEIKKWWKKVKISDFCEEIVDCLNRTAPKVDYKTEYKMIRTSNIKNGYIDTENVNYVTKEVFDKWTRRSIPKIWDILLTREAPLWEIWIVRNNDNIFLWQRIVWYRVNNNLANNIFIYYSFLAPDLQWQIKAYWMWSTVEHMRVPDTKELIFSLPPLPTQQKIASILSKYDDLIENNNKRIKILEETAQSIYEEWFVKYNFPWSENIKMIDSENDDFGMIPEGWEVKKVEEMIKKLPTWKKYDNKTVQEKWNIPVLDQWKSWIIWYHNEEPWVIASIENPIITFANHTCYQKIIMYPFSAIQNIFALISCNENKSNIFWLHYATKDLIKFNDYKWHMPEFITKKLLYPWFNLTEKFWDKIKWMIFEIYNLQKQNQNLKETRDLLIPRLVSGELDVENLDVK